MPEIVWVSPRRICLLLLLSACWNARAQQKPHYTQYIQNQYILNPAITGIENYFDLRLSHRHQWVGLQDAPITTYFSVHGPIGKKDFRTTPTSTRIPGENPLGSSFWESYTAAKPHHGVGLQVINDRTGPLNNFSAYATYAYHIGLSPKTSIAAGFGAGLSNLSLNTSKLNFITVPDDPVVYNTPAVVNNLRPDFMAGVYLYSADFFAGFSAQQIIPQQIIFANNTVAERAGKTVPHLFGTAGYRFLMDEDYNLITSVMVKYVDPAPVQVDFNAKVMYRDLIWLGASYRLQEGFAGMLGVNVGNSMNIGYSYDYTTSRLNTVSKGTHEILIGFLLGNQYPDSCPKNIW